MPKDYRCFCRKVKNPEWNRNEGLVPHTCGEVCKKTKSSPVGCIHKCVELCHPGPCPPCTAVVQILCPCGKERKSAKCGDNFLCNNVCGKFLGCGVHTCSQTCHLGDCNSCEEVNEIRKYFSFLGSS